jgi:hypothetical protein
VTSLDTTSVMTDAPPRRLDSLDVFRGLTIAAMILVSTPGTWNGSHAARSRGMAWLTLTDPSFPFCCSRWARGALCARAGAAFRAASATTSSAARFARAGLVLNALKSRRSSARPSDFGVPQRIAPPRRRVAHRTPSLRRDRRCDIGTAGALGGARAVPVPACWRAGGQSASFIDRALSAVTRWIRDSTRKAC